MAPVLEAAWSVGRAEAWSLLFGGGACDSKALPGNNEINNINKFTFN